MSALHLHETGSSTPLLLVAITLLADVSKISPWFTIITATFTFIYTANKWYWEWKERNENKKQKS